MCDGVRPSKYMQVHHINEEAYGKEKITDVVLLCAACHKNIERLLKKKTFNIERYSDKEKEVYKRSKK